MPKLKTHRGAAKRFKKTEDRQVPAQQGVQAAHPDEQDAPSAKRALRGTIDGRRRRHAEARADAAVQMKVAEVRVQKCRVTFQTLS